MEKKKENKKVDFAVFVWAVSIMLGLFAYAFGGLASLDGKVNATNEDVVEMKVLLSGVANDVGWLKDYFVDNGFK